MPLIAAVVLFGALLMPTGAHALEPGDSNRDLRVSAADLPALIRILNGQPANDGADANRDGFVLADDVGATVARIFGRPLFAPTVTPTLGVTASVTPTSSVTPSATGPPVTGTATGSPTRTATLDATATPTATISIPPAPSSTPTPTGTSTSAVSPTITSTSAVSPTVTQTPSPTATGSPTETATSAISTPTASATQSATATVPAATTTPTMTPTATGPPAVTRCSDTLPEPLAIPDNNPTGVSNSFVVADDVAIADLDVEVVLGHTFVGDLRVTVTHVTTATSVVLFNRVVGGMCSEENVAATFDNQAARFASFTCSTHEPALGGGLVPDGFLGELSGQSLAGTWRLAVVDLEPQDQGTLVSWCLKANSTAPVVTSIRCNGMADCQIALNQPFVLQFEFADRDGNASSYRVTARDPDGPTVPIESGVISPTAGAGMVTVNVPGFTCNDPPCNDTLFEFFVVVIDANGQESPFASIVVTSLGT